MRVFPILLEHSGKLTNAFIQTVPVKQPEISAGRRHSRLIDIRGDDLPDLLSVQESQHTEMIRGTAAWVVQGTSPCSVINCRPMRHASLEDLARQPHGESGVPRHAVEHPSTRE